MDRHAESRHWLERGAWFCAGTLGAGAMYLFDPVMGHRRRILVRDRSAAMLRRTGRRLGRLERRMAADAHGFRQRVTHLRPAGTELPNDADLAQRVESMIFRDQTLPKGRININVEHGVVVLRGALERQEQIRALELAARRVPGVKDVRSYLHLTGSVAPNKRLVLHAS
jgi:hypothetical protein